MSIRTVCIAAALLLVGGLSLGWARDGSSGSANMSSAAATSEFPGGASALPAAGDPATSRDLPGLAETAEVQKISLISWGWIQDWLTYRWREAADSPELKLVGHPVALLGYWVGARAARLGAVLSPDGAQDESLARPGTPDPAPPAAAADPRAALIASRGPMLRDVLVARPVLGEESSGFGYRRDPFTNRSKRHKGLDFKGDRGEPVRAAGAGVVVVARRRGGYGRVVMIDHGMGLETRYAHLRRIVVSEGEFVTANAVIGLLGSSGRATGPHLHFEVRIDGEAIDPHHALDQQDLPLAEQLEALWDWLM